MPSADTYFKIDERKPKNAFLLEYLKNSGKTLTAFAEELKINKATLSIALNKGKIPKGSMLKIAKYFGVDSLEIFS